MRFDERGIRPRAVEGWMHEGVAGSVDASAEVIVSAGAFNTTQVLKLSCIGPKSELSLFNIYVVLDLSGVSTNLQDRYETSHSSDDPCLKKRQSGATNRDRGIYGSNGISLGIVKKSSAAEEDPDLFIAVAPVKLLDYYPGYSTDSTTDARYWTWIVLKFYTCNKVDTVTLQPSNPRDVPQIHFNYLTMRWRSPKTYRPLLKA
ncbi:hypothetical protein EDB81DRAFT_892266 [Dactylonectria macrodidyma]|uniref:Glucose-methanol-choline oxidoreductase N-terminal domain-containing protein n=1 Tax=Dactylonectria macrodidyma TaxID=307937 RepID=A0A9P9DDR7_9HYPO|nr:hypothetical protein EDB81DRAFT_892266 [Dactylonectria macrodidyma]